MATLAPTTEIAALVALDALAELLERTPEGAIRTLIADCRKNVDQRLQADRWNAYARKVSRRTTRDRFKRHHKGIRSQEAVEA